MQKKKKKTLFYFEQPNRVLASFVSLAIDLINEYNTYSGEKTLQYETLTMPSNFNMRSVKKMSSMTKTNPFLITVILILLKLV